MDVWDSEKCEDCKFNETAEYGDGVCEVCIENNLQEKHIKESRDE